MMELMKGLGEVQGCDMSERALDYCRRRGLDNLVLQEESHGNLETYDVITMLDVIEHVDDDRGLVSELGKHLTPGGKLIITAPALPRLAIW